MYPKMTDSKVNHSSYKKSGKKCNHKKEIKFKEDFSKLLEKVYTQNLNKHRCSIVSSSQLKTCKRKREILEYEEDISNKLKGMKLYDMDDDDKNTENESLCSSIHPSKLSVYPKVPGYVSNSYINDAENIAFFRRERLNVLHFDPMNECLEGNELQTLLFSVNPAENQDIRISQENFFNKTDTEFCFSHCTYPENDVRMSEILNASFASKTNLYSFGDMQSSMIHSNEASNSNDSSFVETNQNENNMASCLLKKILEDIEDLRPKCLEVDQNLKIFDNSLVFTNKKIYHSCGMSESSIAFSEKKSIFSEPEDNHKIDDLNCKESYLKHNDTENELKLEMQTSNNVYVAATDGNLDDASLIKKTILDLFLLEIKIKQCKGVLKKFGITSDSHDSFKKSKLKSAKLIKTYKILMNKKNKENTRLEKSRKRAFTRKHVLVENTSNVRFSNMPTLTEEEEEKDERDENEIKNSFPHKEEKRNKKRKQKTDDEMQKPGRSKTLDECIKRVNNSKIYSGRSIKESKCLEENEISQNQNFKESRNTKVSIKRELLFTKEKVPMHKQNSHDPINQTIDKILSQLPPVENILNSSQSSNENKKNISLNELVDNDDASDKSFVIFPYVTT